MNQITDSPITYCFTKFPSELTSLIHLAAIEFLDDEEMEVMYISYPNIPEVALAYYDFQYLLTHDEIHKEKLTKLLSEYPDNLSVKCDYVVKHFSLGDEEQFSDILFILDKEVKAIFNNEEYPNVVDDGAYRQLLFILLRVYYTLSDTEKWNRIYDLIRDFPSPSFAEDSAQYMKGLEPLPIPSDFEINLDFLDWIDDNYVVLLNKGFSDKPHFEEAYHILNMTLGKLTQKQISEIHVSRDPEKVVEDILWVLSQGFQRYLVYESDTQIEFFFNCLYWASYHNAHQYVPIFFELLSYISEDAEYELLGDIQYNILQAPLCKLLHENQDHLFDFFSSLDGDSQEIKSTISAILLSCYYEDKENQSVIEIIEKIYEHLSLHDHQTIGWLVTSMLEFDYPNAIERMKHAYKNKWMDETTHGTLEENLDRKYFFYLKNRFAEEHNFTNYNNKFIHTYNKMHPGFSDRVPNEEFINLSVLERTTKAKEYKEYIEDNIELFHRDIDSDDVFFDESDDLFDNPFYNTFDEPYKRDSPKVGRNDACPCGSGKKYKKCCLNK